MKEGKVVHKSKKSQMSQEEVIETAAKIVAGTINPEAMGIKAEDVDLEEFIRLFVQKTSEIMRKDEKILLGIGTYLNQKGNLYTDDLEPIIRFIEESSGKTFKFFNGILIWMGKNEIYATWISDQHF